MRSVTNQRCSNSLYSTDFRVFQFMLLTQSTSVKPLPAVRIIGPLAAALQHTKGLTFTSAPGLITLWVQKIYSQTFI